MEKDSHGQGDPDGAELQARMDTALLRLPPRRRNIVLLSRIDGWTYAKIADAHRISEGRVRRHLAIGMSVLVREVLHDNPQPWWRRWLP